MFIYFRRGKNGVFFSRADDGKIIFPSNESKGKPKKEGFYKVTNLRDKGNLIIADVLRPPLLSIVYGCGHSRFFSDPDYSEDIIVKVSKECPSCLDYDEENEDFSEILASLKREGVVEEIKFL